MTLALPAERTTRIPLALAVTIALVLGYAAFEIALFVGHDPWNDEGQAWRWARELDTFVEFLAVPGEGHPPLWYWTLKVLQLFLTFDQARVLTLGIAIVNAVLLARLFDRQPIILALLLFSSILLNSWGYHFRPYGLLLTVFCVALLCDRAQKPLAALWLFALGCGLHLFGGVFFGFYLLVLLSRRVPIRWLIAPAILALLFAASAAASGLGNLDGRIYFGNFAIGVYDVFTRPFRILLIPRLAAFIVVPPLIIWGLRKSPVILISMAVMIGLFATFAAAVYGKSEWHIAFVLMLVLMAFLLAWDKATKWPLALLLVPQMMLGIASGTRTILAPQFVESEAYAAIIADAGDRLDTERNLVGRPDHALTATAARHGFAYLSGNDGKLIKAVDLRTRLHYQFDKEFMLGLEGPYWLLCHECAYAVRILRAAGRTVTEVAAPREFLNSTRLGAYRVED